jgi:hypothetical protein
MTQYDPKVIHRFATYLYGRAHLLVGVYTVVGVLSGAGLGKAFAIYTVLTSPSASLAALGSLVGSGLGSSYTQASPPAANWTLLGVVVGGFLGFCIGWSKAFLLKLQAQAALCQAKIEENTRNN